MNDAICPGPPQPWSPYRFRVTLPGPGRHPASDQVTAWAAAEVAGAEDLMVTCTAGETVITMTVRAETEQAAAQAAAVIGMALAAPAPARVPLNCR